MLDQTWNGVRVAICMGCGANFFRAGDLASWEGWSHDVPRAADRQAVHKTATFHCPACSTRMESLRFPLTPPLTIERCPACQGVLLDFEEIRRVPELTRFARERAARPPS
jgi:hypothetical protein